MTPLSPEALNHTPAHHKPFSKPITDRAHDVLRESAQSLDPIFKPRNIAVIGATETMGSVGRTLLKNLIATPFGGTVYPVNPKRASVQGIKAYPDIASIPDQVDLAVIATPAPSVPNLIRECAAAGVKGVIVISAGFKEMGAPGIALEEEILKVARESGIRIIGPNCLGVMNPLTGMNATFAKGIARPGNVAFISQSGALCTAVLDWSLREMVGFSAFVSIGSMLDVDWGDLIDYLGNDPRTNAILIYMESVGDARSFLSAAREVALTKPIIVIKAGRTEAAAKAAASHTGSLAGSDKVLDAAFERSGVLRVNSISDLFYMAEVLAKQPRPQGPHLAILTNAGGPGVLATDALINGGGELAEISDNTLNELNGLLPVHWSHNNPIDVLGDAGPDRYAKSLEIASRDPNIDGMLVVLTPQDMTDATLTADALKVHAQSGKPVLASWMGGPDVEAGIDILNRAGIPTFQFPDTAARAFNYMWRYSHNLKALYETPASHDDIFDVNRVLASEIIDEARRNGRTLLTEAESKQLLGAYGIPTVETRVALSPEDAIAAAQEIGFPVVLKLHSFTVTHKTDVDGVQLNLKDAEAVQAAFERIKVGVTKHAGEEAFNGVTVQPMAKLDGYELIIGSSLDAQFGPVLLFGSGGQLVEVYKDSALALPPLNATLARRLMEKTQIFKALQGVRGRAPVDMAKLEALLVRFSQLVAEQHWIKEIDINPLQASPEQLIALDARVLLHDVSTQEADLPPLAIRAYPSQYVTTATLQDNTEVTIRPIRPEDEPLLVKFHETLSERSVMLRYFQPLQLDQRTAHERLIRVCFSDYDRELPLVAEYSNGDGEREIIGVGRLSEAPHRNQAQVSLLVSDQWQGRGLGTKLMELLLQAAREEKLERVSAEILPENQPMQTLCKSAGFTLNEKDDSVCATLEL